MNKTAVATLILLLGLGLFFFFNQWMSPPVSNLEGVEVQEYEGQDLSSINDFRENSIKGPQKIDGSTYRLEVTGLVEEPKNYTYAQIIKGFKNYDKVITLNCVEGWSATVLWRGVLIKDIIQESKPRDSGTVVILYGVDGYSTSFSRDYLENNNILLSYKINNVTLPPREVFPFN